MSTLLELRSLAKELGIKGSSKANKETLIKMLESHGAAESHAVGMAEEVHATTTKATKAPRVVIAKEDKPAPAPAPVETPAAPVEALSEAGKKARQPSMWNDFLQSYKKEHNVSLKEAMLQKDAYAAYKAKRG